MRRLKRTFTVVAMLIMAISANAYPWLSPYVYCMNNPVKFVDPDGRDIIIYYTKNNNTYVYKYNGTQKNIPDNNFVKSVVNTYKYLKARKQVVILSKR